MHQCTCDATLWKVVAGRTRTDVCVLLFCCSRPSYPDNSELGELRKGPVGMYRMEQIHPRDRHFEQLESFPGPLTENVSEDVVLYVARSHLAMQPRM